MSAIGGTKGRTGRRDAAAQRPSTTCAGCAPPAGSASRRPASSTATDPTPSASSRTAPHPPLRPRRHGTRPGPRPTPGATVHSSPADGRDARGRPRRSVRRPARRLRRPLAAQPAPDAQPPRGRPAPRRRRRLVLRRGAAARARERHWDQLVDEAKGADSWLRRHRRRVREGYAAKRATERDPGGRPPFGFRRNHDDEARSSPTRIACPSCDAPSSSPPSAGPTARSPRPRACRCSPSGGCSRARSTSAGCGPGSARTGRRWSIPPPVGGRPGGPRHARAPATAGPPVRRRLRPDDAPLLRLRPAPDRRHRALPAPGPVRGVHRRPARAPEARPRPAQGDARAQLPRRRVRGDRPRGPRRRVAGSRPDRRGRGEARRDAGARPPRAGPHRTRARRGAGPLPARPRRAGARGGDGGARRAGGRARTPARRREALDAAEVVAYLRDLPRLWDDAPDSRRALTESLFERVEVLGLRRMHLEPTQSAIAAGLVEAFSSASAGYGRGERI